MGCTVGTVKSTAARGPSIGCGSSSGHNGRSRTDATSDETTSDVRRTARSRPTDARTPRVRDRRRAGPGDPTAAQHLDGARGQPRGAGRGGVGVDSVVGSDRGGTVRSPDDGPRDDGPRDDTPSTTVPLPSAIGSTLLPAIALGPGALTVNPDPIVEIFEDTDGRVCTKIDSVVVADSCAPAGTGFYASAWSGGQVIVVDPAVDASVDAAGAGCTSSSPISRSPRCGSAPASISTRRPSSSSTSGRSSSTPTVAETVPVVVAGQRSGSRSTTGVLAAGGRLS